ncbi:sulfite reductase flavoprotein component, partial [Camillea tinctor]
ETLDSPAPRLPGNSRNNQDNFNMQLKQPESAGGVLADQTASRDTTKTPRVEFTKQSSSLPFGQPVPLSSISGPTYVTGQLLVQQIAYALSDKIFSYSPETFDLDVAIKDWAKSEEKNIHGYPTSVLPLQTRSGAGAFALGYIFSKDFDLNKRHIPQTLLAPSLSLRHLRAALDQLSLLYGVASPFVAHIAAADYVSDVGFVSEYGTALQLSEELGLGLVSSTSTYESQHMSLFATLMAKILPTLHIYDGVRTSRETLRVIDVLSQVGIADIFNRVSKTAEGLNKRLDNAGRVLELLQALNDELGTDYEPFEYVGHEAAETVFVVFGSVESQLAKQVVSKLATDGAKIGVVSVRVYRPFIEEAFIKALPVSVRNVAVLGQVANDAAVVDASVQSVLYSDVLTAVSFSTKWPVTPVITDIKYPVSQVFTPSSFAITLAQSASKTTGSSIQLPQLESVEQYIFWDVDDSTTRFAPTVVGGLLSRDSTSNVYLNESHDNLVQGGKTIDAPYPVEVAGVVVVAEEKLLKEVAISRSVKAGEEDVEKPRNISLYVLDSALSPAFEADASAARLLVELAFLKVSTLDARPEVREKFSALQSDSKCLKKIDVPASWAEIAEDDVQALPQILKTNSFDLQLSDWQAAAKDISLRPDLTVKTHTIRTYDRNIFHIEFDLGDSGLTYKIGEALGIHAENDPELVNEFIESYGLNADGLAQVPSRENSDIVETRTVYQSLRFYESLAEFATDELEKKKLAALGTQEGADEFKRRSESARPSFPDLARLVGPLKRREYSIASAQAVTPNAVALMIVVVDWVDSKGRTRYGQATRYLSRLPVGASVTASVKPSVMKLPIRDDAPLIMAGLGTGLAPFRAFEIGAILLYLGSRHQREEYLYGEEWEAYLDAGVPQKIYIQDRMQGSFYLCGPTWPVPDVTDASGKKEDGRYVLEVY